MNIQYEIIRAYLKTIFTDPPKRGDANKQYNLSEIDELELALIYILKDGGENFCSSNIDFEVLSDLKKKSLIENILNKILQLSLKNLKLNLRMKN